MIDVKKYAALIGMAFCLYGCRWSAGSPSLVTESVLSCDTMFNELNDSLFVPGRVPSLWMDEDNLYYSDYAGQLVVIDSLLRLKSLIGKQGTGPGELLSVSYFDVTGKDSVYIQCEGKNSFELFVNGHHSGHIAYPDRNLSFATRFFAKDGFVYHSVASDASPVIRFNKDGLVTPMCDYTDFDRRGYSRHSARHLLKGADRFWVIGSVLPVFQEYSYSGKLLREYDLTAVPEIRKMYDVYTSGNQVSSSYFTVIQDACYQNGKIYLLIGQKDSEHGYSCNTVAALDVEADIHHVSTYILPGKAYDCICADRSCLAGFNGVEGRIEFFSFQK